MLTLGTVCAEALAPGDDGAFDNVEVEGALDLPFSENDGHQELDFIVEQPAQYEIESSSTHVRAKESRIRASL